MVRKGQHVTDAELSVMRVLWEQGSCTIREITERVYPSNSESDYATVKKLLSRLETKQFVLRHRDQLAHLFQALVTLDDLVALQLQDLADNLCGGSRTPLLMNLLQNENVTPRQQKLLRDLIDDLSKSKRSKSAKKGRTK